MIGYEDVFVCGYCYLLHFEYFAECHFQACLRSCVSVLYAVRDT